VYSLYAEKVRKRTADKQLEKTRYSRPAAGKAAKKPTSAVGAELKRFNKYTTEQIEEMIMSLEEKIAGLQEEFGDEKYYHNPELLASLQERLKVGEAELDLLYRAYEIRL